MRTSHLALLLCCSLLVLAGCQRAESSAPSSVQATTPTSTSSPASNGVPTDTPPPAPLPTAPVPRCPQLSAATAAVPPAALASLYLTEGTTLTALNAADGRARWSEQLAAASDPITSVAVMSNVVYLVAEDGTVSALEAASGALRWCARAQPLAPATTAVPNPQLVVAQGVVYVTQHGRLNAVTALDASDGRQRWQTSLFDGTFYRFYSIRVDAGLVVLPVQQLAAASGTVTATSALVALDASDGSTRWSIQSPQGQSYIGLTLAQGTAYVLEDGESACPGSSIDAVQEEDGKPLWQVHDQEGCGLAQPVSASGQVFTGEASMSGPPNVYAFDGATGTRRWVATQSSSVVTGPLVDAGVVYVALVGSANGPAQLQALSASSGTALWSWPQGASARAALFETIPRSSGVALGVLAAANGVVYVADGTSLVALSSAGKLLWQAPNLVEPSTTLALPVSGS